MRIKINHFLAIIMCNLATTVFAEDCESQPNMAAVRACVENQSADGVDSSFKQLLNTLKKKNMIEAGNALNFSQTTWLNYRNASCKYTYQIAVSANTGGYPDDFETNCIIEFNSGREKILNRYTKLCEKNKVGCDLK